MILKKENIKSYIHSIVNTLDCSLPVPSEHLQYQKPKNYVIILQILGKLKWSISQSEIYDNLCGGRIKSSNETKLKLEASVTNAKNEQLVRAHASSIIYPKDIRMGFSIPSPAVIHPDMPFMAWVITLHSSQFQGLCKKKSPQRNASKFVIFLESENQDRQLFFSKTHLGLLIKVPETSSRGRET